MIVRDNIHKRNSEFEAIGTPGGAAFLKVLHWFFDYPNKEMSLNDLASKLKISKTSASKIVELLVKQGFLIRESLGKVWRISCNQSHLFNTKMKIPYHLELVYDIIQEILNEYPSARAIVLFGSYRKGDDTEKSDIDIAVELLGNHKLSIKTFTTLPSLGYRMDVKVNLHTFSRNNIDRNLFTNIANGIVLYGLLEVKP